MQAERKPTRRDILKLVSTAGLGFTLIGLAACGQSATPSTPQSTETNATKPTAPSSTTVAAPANNPPSVKTGATVRFQYGGADDVRKALIELLNNKFTAETGINVNMELSPDNRDEKLIATMVAGTAPDVFTSWRDNVTQYADRGQVLDIEPLVQRDYTSEDLKDFYPWQWEGFVLPSGVRFGMPWYVNLWLLRYNKEMFDAAELNPPDDTWDHDTYREAAIKMTKWSNNRPDSLGLYYDPWNWDHYWYKIECWGGDIVDPSDNTRAVFNSEVALEAFEWSRKLLWDDKAMVQNLYMQGQGNDSTSLFAAGRLGMIESALNPRQMVEQVADKVPWAYAHIPKGPVKRKVLGTADGYVIWQKSKVPDAAWELVKFISGTEYQLMKTKHDTRLPARFSALKEWKKLCIDAYPVLDNVNLDAAIEAMEQGYPGHRQLFKKDAQARQTIVPALEKVFITGGSPVTYFNEVAEQVTNEQRA